jgi:hypothetical protein
LSDSPDGHLKRATVFGRSLIQFVAQDLSIFVGPKHARPSGGAVSGMTVSSGGTVEVVGRHRNAARCQTLGRSHCTVDSHENGGSGLLLLHRYTPSIDDLDDRRRQRRNGHQKL